MKEPIKLDTIRPAPDLAEDLGITRAEAENIHDVCRGAEPDATALAEVARDKRIAKAEAERDARREQ